MTTFKNLFTPISINTMSLSNRIVMTAMHLGYTPEGEVTDRLVDFYVERARGGVGLIIVGGCPVDEYGGMSSMVCIYHDRFMPGLKRLTEAVKRHGSRIAAQLYQAGRYTHSSMIGGKQPFSASSVRSRLTGETPRALELDEIPLVQSRFAEAAMRAKDAGFDAVEILGSAGYLISQFLSPLTNKRDDEYGGTFENRMRFGIEVAQKVRQAVGPDYPILMRLAGNDFMEEGNTNHEARACAVELERAGVDLFNVTGGWHETRVPQLTSFVPRGAYVYLARGIKSVVSVPVLASNRINRPEIAEAILRNGEADLVTMARSMLADPHMPKKAKEGRSDLIFHCVACNQGCFDNIFQGRPATCLVNPLAGMEGEWRVTPATSPRKVLIIGGGPAGMKAACTAAERGHQVSILERQEQLGGQVVLNRLLPGREEMATAAEDLIQNLEAQGVEILINTEANADRIVAMAPDVVVLATGARPSLPPIAGIEDPRVMQAWDVLGGDPPTLGKRIVVVGGNAVGLETALYLASLGTLPPEVLHFLVANRAESFETLGPLLNKGVKEVTVIEMTKRVGENIGASTRWTVMAELRRLGVTVMTGTKAVGVVPEGLRVEKMDGHGETLSADAIILAAGSIPQNPLEAQIRALVPEVHVIGDAKEARKAIDAIREGLLVGLKI
jgi:2,4-dienoyl-CoA reductase (NADPH2)